MVTVRPGLSPTSKRLQNEYSRYLNIIENQFECKLCQHDENRMIFYMKNSPNSVKIIISYSNSYPFVPPKLYINKKQYLSFLSPKNFYLLDNELKGGCYGKCRCCKSIMCADNWSPTLNIYNIIKEVRTNINLKNTHRELLLVKIIKKKFLNQDINIEQFLV